MYEDILVKALSIGKENKTNQHKHICLACALSDYLTENSFRGETKKKCIELYTKNYTKLNLWLGRLIRCNGQVAQERRILQAFKNEVFEN